MTATARQLYGETAERDARRRADRRSEPRHENLVDCSTLFFRGACHVVRVGNISTRGAMIVSDLEPRIGESVIVRFEGCSPIYAAVRWVRGGRIGLSFGTEIVVG